MVSDTVTYINFHLNDSFEVNFQSTSYEPLWQQGVSLLFYKTICLDILRLFYSIKEQEKVWS